MNAEFDPGVDAKEDRSQGGQRRFVFREGVVHVVSSRDRKVFREAPNGRDPLSHDETPPLSPFQIVRLFQTDLLVHKQRQTILPAMPHLFYPDVCVLVRQPSQDQTAGTRQIHHDHKKVRSLSITSQDDVKGSLGPHRQTLSLSRRFSWELCQRE